MDITALPYNQFLGIERAPEEGRLLALPDGAHFTNHLGTVHASALMSLAEASSGEALIRAFGDVATSIVPVVRRFECKFRKPARGRLTSSVSFSGQMDSDLRQSIDAKGKAIVELAVDIYDEADTRVLSAVVEWFIAKR
jgi:acyl-coenzyme A thioesterase PaaI-like protein